MRSPKPRRVSPAALLVALSLGGPAPEAAAQAAADSPRVQKSVYGTLSSVDKSLNGVIMRSEDGQRLAWRFEPRIIAELARFKPGDPMIVIYRQTSPNEKRVTAVAFPGTADVPTYLNLTGARVALRSAPAKDGVCQPDAAPVTETTIPIGGVAEVAEGCWCCTEPDETCIPGNKTGQGRAVLVQCFK